MEYYDRYKNFRNADGSVKVIPFVKIPNNPTDIHLAFKKSTMRLDNLSYKYYGDANYAWLILQANPQYGGYEYAFEDGIDLRIPYPLTIAIEGYENGVKAAIDRL